MLMKGTLRNLLVVASLVTAVACASSAARGGIEEQPPMPLAGLVAQPLIVLPAHYMRTGDSIAWSTRIPSSREYLAQFDSILEKTFKDRGVPDIWVFPPELARTAQRNAGYVANPYQLAAQGLRPPSRNNQEQLTDPLASQIRAWVALHGARSAFLPIEIRFEGRSDSAQAVLRLALLDARLARVSFMVDVRSDMGSDPRGEVLNSLARNVAALALPH